MKVNLFELELFIAKILRVGVLISGALMLVGWLTEIQFSGNPFVKFQEYQPESFFIVLRNLYHSAQWGLLISYAGLLVLISLPVIRVFMTGIMFIKQKEFILAGLAFFVLSALLLSFSLGLEL